MPTREPPPTAGVSACPDASGLAAEDAPVGAATPLEQAAARLLALTSDWFWEHDADLRFRWWRPQAGAATGGLQPVRGQWDAYRALIAFEEPFRDFEVQLQDATGAPLHLALSGAPVFDAQRRCTGYRGVARDVSEHHQNEHLRRIHLEMARQLSLADSAEQGLQAALAVICTAESWACGEYWAVDAQRGALVFNGYWDVWGDQAAPEIRGFFAGARDVVFPPDVGLAGRVWSQRTPLWIADLAQEPRLLRKDLARLAGLRAALLFPTVAAAEVTGVFAFWSQAVRPADPRTVEALSAVGSQVGQFLRRKHAEAVLRASEARFRALTELSSDWYWEQDPRGHFTCLEGRHADRVRHLMGRHPREAGLLPQDGWALHRERVAGWQPFRDVVMSGEIGGELLDLCVSGAPVFDAQGRPVGYRGIARDVTDQRRAEERIRYLAMHDGLTGLPNRVMFSQLLAREVESARRYQRRFAVLFIDLDRFKIINDSLGHQAGDELLREVAQRLQQTLRSSDVVARLGGDEFVVLLQETPTEAEANAAARKILSAIIRPVQIGGQECRVTCSIGLSMFPADAQDEPSLMRSADMAMYLAKEAGKNNVQRFSGEGRTVALEKMTIETHLRRALERHELSLRYQAKLSLTSHRISGVEALLRWHHPELGAVSPAQFIPIAEETGLIVPIGKWVLRTACEQSMAWQRQGLPPVCMAVNLSPRQFADPSLVGDLADLLHETGLPPQWLELEITESMVMNDTARTLALLREIKRLGVSLAIDDFGTGYSSLAQLRRFPIDTLKVDRSFIREITHSDEDQAITEAIITMGKTLSLTVVAEGVETSEQMDLLREKSCDEMQGYHFSRPVSAEEFAVLLRSHRDAPRQRRKIPV